MTEAPTGAQPRTQPAPSGDPAAALSALQSTHQLADAKVGILAGVQAALVAAVGPWAESAHRTWAHDGLTAYLFAALFAVFVVGFLGAVACLALALRPRLWRPQVSNRFSYRSLAAADAMAVAEQNDRREREELWHMCRFLATVTLVKCRYVDGALGCTAVMAAVSGLSLMLQAFLN